MSDEHKATPEPSAAEQAAYRRSVNWSSKHYNLLLAARVMVNDPHGIKHHPKTVALLQKLIDEF